MISTHHLGLLVCLGMAATWPHQPAAAGRHPDDKPVIRRLCDQDFCDDVVTMCTANRKCMCNIKNIACRKTCVDCLEEKFGKCCGCVHGLCPSAEGPQSSHVGDIADSSYEDLFSVLTETDDLYGRWTVANGSSWKLLEHKKLGSLQVALDKNKRLVARPGEEQESGWASLDGEQPSSCVVAFINKQLGMGQCKRYCRSMGASSFRWFYEGCCECVGKSCIHYGLDQPMCRIEYES